MDIKNSPESSFYHRANAFLQKNILGLIILGLFTSALWDTMKGTSGILYNAILRTLTFVFHSYVETIHEPIGEGQGDQLVKTIYTLLFAAGVNIISLSLLWGIRRVRSKYREAEGMRYKIKKLAIREEYLEAMKALEEKISRSKATNPNNIVDPMLMQNELNALREKAKSVGALDSGVKTITELAEENESIIKRTKMSIKAVYASAAFTLLAGIYLSALLAGDLYTREASTFVERSIEILAPTIPPDKHLQLRAKYRSVDSAQKFYDLHDELHTIAKEKNVTLPKFTVIKR